MLNVSRKRLRGWRPVFLVLCLGMMPGARAAEALASVDEATAARTLYDAGNFLGALPYYERLAKKEPQSPLFAERLAISLSAQFASMPAGEQRTALVARTRAEVQRAQALGVDGQVFRTVVAFLQGGNAEVPTEEAKALAAGEAAFARREYDKALAAYEAVAAANPMSYSARLFAGDVHFVKGDADAAGKWFQAAIDLDPDQETAHRYWGDALAKARRDSEALPHYINAVVAEPYRRNAWTGLQQWASRNRFKLQKPDIPVPAAPTVQSNGDAKPNINIPVDPARLENARSGAAWLLYSMVRANWITKEFSKQFPQEQKYRHSLAEEASALRAVLTFVKSKQAEMDLKGADKEMQGLLLIGERDLIEPYVLLQAADEGIARDYAAYRAVNRAKLAAYIQQIVLVPQ